jgi:hypothetical protein
VRGIVTLPGRADLPIRSFYDRQLPVTILSGQRHQTQVDDLVVPLPASTWPGVARAWEFPACRAPMAGVVVADFSRVLAAPYATMLFGDLGAEVIKVERQGIGDHSRAWGPPFARDEATYFLSVNRNKRSLTADLSDPAERTELLELVRRADVLIENFRPGTMQKHGLGWRDVREIDPWLVYCSVTGFGAGKGAALHPGTTCWYRPWAV